jgi:hypothetical protein
MRTGHFVQWGRGTGFGAFRGVVESGMSERQGTAHYKKSTVNLIWHVVPNI